MKVARPSRVVGWGVNPWRPRESLTSASSSTLTISPFHRSRRDAGALVEQLAGKVGGRAHAGGGEIDALLLGELDQLGQGLHAQRLMDDEDVREVDAAGHRCEVLERVVFQLHQMRGDRQRTDRTEQQGCTVARHAGHDLMGDVAPRARLVVDDHRLADVVGQLLRNQPGCRVGGTAGGEADHEGHGLFRRKVIGMGRRQACRRDETGHGQPDGRCRDGLAEAASQPRRQPTGRGECAGGREGRFSHGQALFFGLDAGTSSRHRWARIAMRPGRGKSSGWLNPMPR